MATRLSAYLYLEDGEILSGTSFGYRGESDGEVVFTTGMTGYNESVTDPSYAGQILVFTYPLIGNYGVPHPKKINKHLLANFESEQVWVKGVVVSTVSRSFDGWLTRQKIPGISGIDTRALTQKIREKGVLQGRISSKKNPSLFKNKPNGVHLVDQVSLHKVVIYHPDVPNGKHIALIDCGVKHGMVRELLRLGYRVTRVPWNINPLVATGNIDGIVCSNGPGDPKDCAITIQHIRLVLQKNIPFLGVCLGHQLLALAIGADTYKLPYGHRGVNQPCQDVTNHKAYITSQNHGYAVKRGTLPKNYREWFVNLNDLTIEGIRHQTKNIQSVQFHPEGCPGPFDTRGIYKFI
ncbi:glutamine-hydrolyzing carbamoyl-phosphate synthase small subunit [Candidatus Gottesmanbacteria bacterium]|nr:glutamine-hydrolyzing carbamoyl-phosphate synthase small subunit [Candidatus Gottesmanbacteria bacterium]